MTATLTPSERLTRKDQEVVDLKQAFIHLAESPEVDGSHDARWVDILRRIQGLRTDLQADDFDKAQLAQIYDTILELRDLIDGPRTLDTLDNMLLAIERVRHVVRDALDEHVAGIADNIGVVVDELLDRLPGVRRDDIGELVGVDRRTVARWVKQSTSPNRRLRTVARLVAILRHNWTPDGIIAWFHRPRRDLHGRTPLALIDEGNYDEEILIAAARAGRSQYAS